MWCSSGPCYARTAKKYEKKDSGESNGRKTEKTTDSEKPEKSRKKTKGKGRPKDDTADEVEVPKAKKSKK